MKNTPWYDSLNPEFLENLQIYFGDRAEPFLASLPERIEQYEKLWNIKVLEPFPNLSINYVAPAIGKNNESYIFKCGVPNSEFSTEIDTLSLMDGIGLPKMFEFSKEDAVLLQQQIFPGTSLREELRLAKLTDAEATEVAAIAMKGYFKQASKPIPDEYSFPHISDWLSGLEKLWPDYDGRKEVFPKELLERSELLLPDLLTSMDSTILLHGDLHHDNILSHDDGWMIIDPKGVLGEASFEIAAFLRNPYELLHYTDLKSTMQKRIDIFSEVLELKRERIIAWMIVQAVLSVWWHIESNKELKTYDDLDKTSQTVFECALSVSDLI